MSTPAGTGWHTRFRKTVGPVVGGGDGPQGPEDDSLASLSPRLLPSAQAPDLSAAVQLGHHGGLEGEQGGAGCPQAAPDLASDEGRRSGMWPKLHMFPAGVTSGRVEMDFVTSLAGSLLARVCTEGPRVCSHGGQLRVLMPSPLTLELVSVLRGRKGACQPVRTLAESRAHL